MDDDSLISKLIRFHQQDECNEPPERVLAKVLEFGRTLKPVATGDHITVETLFEFSRNATPLAPRQERHLKNCPECRELLKTYRRWNHNLHDDSNNTKAS